MKISFFKKLNKFAFLIILSPMLVQVDFLFAREPRIHSLPIKKKFNELDKQSNNLIPLPVGDINSSSLKVNFDRNPFQKPLKTEYPTIENLYSNLKFRGLAQSDKKPLAIIETVNGQKFYGVGDTLDNGFIIQLISLENVSVDISNGTKNYRLTLSDIQNYK